MNAVSCTTTTSCEAVGVTPGSNGYEGTVAESWNGSAWTLQSTTSPSTTLGSQLTALSCASAPSCTGVGWYTSNNVGNTYGQQETVVEDWNGTAWTLESSPNPSSGGRVGAGS